jgi:hypothetical protein
VNGAQHNCDVMSAEREDHGWIIQWQNKQRYGTAVLGDSNFVAAPDTSQQRLAVPFEDTCAIIMLHLKKQNVLV